MNLLIYLRVKDFNMEQYLLKQLVSKGEEMRNTQKQFFKCRDDPAQRSVVLAESKKLEREFDKLIEECKKKIK